jgi:hypothetical protein
MSITKKQNQLRELIILIVITIASIILWETPVIYPIKIMVILFHEISHGIAAILTGGKVIELNIALDLSGICKIEDGNSFIIASSGYLGSLLFGMLLFYSSLNKKLSHIVLLIISGIIIIFLINSSKNEYLILITTMVLILLIVIIYKSPTFFSSILLKALGIISCIYVLIDIKQDIFDSTNSYSDASMLAELTGIHQAIWGLIWLGLSAIGILYLLIKSHKNKFN